MKHLIFDCGGVLVYPRCGSWAIPFKMAEVLGPRTEDLHTPRYAQAHSQAARWLDESRLVADTQAERLLRLRYLQELDGLMNWRLSPEQLRLLADDFTDNIQRYGFFEDTGPWLRRWKQRFSLAILSDAMPSILVFLEQYGILSLFDAAVISTHVGAIKPDRRMYRAALNALGARPEDSLFVDDRAGNAEGAVALGMHAVQMARDAFPPDERWDGPVVRDFEELNRWIEA